MQGVYNINREQAARGEQLRTSRLAKEMTLQQLAQLTGFSVSFFSKIEHGVGNPSVNNIRKIYYVLGITANEQMLTKGDSEKLSSSHKNESYVLKSRDWCLIYSFANAFRLDAALEGHPNFKVNVMTLTGSPQEKFSSQHSYDEFDLVAKGSISIDLEDGTHFEWSEGDCIMVRARTEHTTRNLSTQECISYWMEILEP